MREPLIHDVAGFGLVFGLDWSPLLGKRGQAQANTLARRERAGYLVVAGNPVAAVGRVASSRLPGGRTLHSAAQAFAQCYPQGAVAAVFDLPHGTQWLVAVHDGVVVARSDTFPADALQFESLLTALRDSFPGLR